MVDTANMTGAIVESIAARIPARAIPPSQGGIKLLLMRRDGRACFGLGTLANLPVAATIPSVAVIIPTGAINRAESKEAFRAVFKSLAAKTGCMEA